MIGRVVGHLNRLGFIPTEARLKEVVRERNIANMAATASNLTGAQAMADITKCEEVCSVSHH